MILLNYNYKLIMKTKHLFSIGLVAVLMCALLASCKNEEETTPKNPSWNVEPGKVLPETPTTQIGDGKVKVFDNVIPVKESEITSVVSDTSAQHYTITYSDNVPDIKPGNVVVVRDGDESRIILVFNVKTTGNIVASSRCRRCVSLWSDEDICVEKK